MHVGGCGQSARGTSGRGRGASRHRDRYRHRKVRSPGACGGGPRSRFFRESGRDFGVLREARDDRVAGHPELDLLDQRVRARNGVPVIGIEDAADDRVPRERNGRERHEI